MCVCGLEREALFCMCEETGCVCLERERERGAMGFVYEGETSSVNS